MRDFRTDSKNGNKWIGESGGDKTGEGQEAEGLLIKQGCPQGRGSPVLLQSPGREEQDRLSSNSVIVGAELPPGVVLLRGIPQAKRWSVCQRPLFPKGHHGQVQGALMADSGLGIVLGLKENCFCFLSVS